MAAPRWQAQTRRRRRGQNLLTSGRVAQLGRARRSHLLKTGRPSALAATFVRARQSELDRRRAGAAAAFVLRNGPRPAPPTPARRQLDELARRPLGKPCRPARMLPCRPRATKIDWAARERVGARCKLARRAKVRRLANQQQQQQQYSNTTSLATMQLSVDAAAGAEIDRRMRRASRAPD